MTTRAEAAASWIDTVKLVLAVVLLVAGIAAFYYLSDKSYLLRVLAVLGSLVASGGLLFTTIMGRQFALFLKDARVEVRKVVWPSRQETMQSTMVVVALVLVVGIVLWTLDAALFWGVSHLTGQGK
jgi:preprotein translocase subunit SecE